MTYLLEKIEKNNLVPTDPNLFLELFCESMCVSEKDENEYYACLCRYILILNLFM